MCNEYWCDRISWIYCSRSICMHACMFSTCEMNWIPNANFCYILTLVVRKKFGLLKVSSYKINKVRFFFSLVLIEEKSTFNAMQSNWNKVIAYRRKVVFTVRWGLFVERASIWAHFHYVQKAQKQTNIKQWTCTLKPSRCAKPSRIQNW